MTRKRTRASLPQILTESCPTCDGRGRIVSVTTIAYEAMRRSRQVARAAPEATRIVVRASATVAAFLCRRRAPPMDRLERETSCHVSVEAVEGSDLARLDVRAI